MDRDQHVKEIARFTAELCEMYNDGECLVSDKKCVDCGMNLEVAERAYDNGIRATEQP